MEAHGDRFPAADLQRTVEAAARCGAGVAGPVSFSSAASVPEEFAPRSAVSARAALSNTPR